jgi:mono/diheme cytochrome c family protein
MRLLAWLVATILVVTVGYVVWAWRSPMPATNAPARTTMDRALLRKGSELAAIGNCVLCHTAPHGKPYAGGRAVPTPFGIVWAPNITPDPETGIGLYSKAAFLRAMHEGVDRLGRHLYPAFPYDHMAKANQNDIEAVWTFLMTRDPVRKVNPTTRLVFPLNQRILLAAWKALFLERQPFTPDPSHSAEWNRGAYLVEGLAHCGACHTPRNIFGAEMKSAPYAGGQVEGWDAPALNANSPAAVPWTAESIEAYLRFGRDDLHGAPAGPMNEVTHSLAAVTATDVAAIATYVADIAGNATPERAALALKAAASRGPVAAPTPQSSSGALVYAGACAQCHGEAGRVPSNPAINLALSSAVHAADPTNFVNVVRSGIRQPEGIAGPFMPGFAEILTETQIRDLASFVRSKFAGKPEWTGLTEALRRSSASR